MSRPDANGGGMSPAEASSHEASGDAIPILEERAVLDKVVVSTGRVRVATHTRLIEEVASATLEGQEVDVTRVPVDRPISGELPQIRTEGDTTIVPLFEEVLVVEKRLMLREELHIRRRATSEQVDVPIHLRKQEAVVKRETD